MTNSSDALASWEKELEYMVEDWGLDPHRVGMLIGFLKREKQQSFEAGVNTGKKEVIEQVKQMVEESSLGEWRIDRWLFLGKFNSLSSSTPSTTLRAIAPETKVITSTGDVGYISWDKDAGQAEEKPCIYCGKSCDWLCYHPYFKEKKELLTKGD